MVILVLVLSIGWYFVTVLVIGIDNEKREHVTVSELQFDHCSESLMSLKVQVWIHWALIAAAAQ